VSPVVDAQSRNGSVYIELTGTKNLKAGMFAQGELELGRNTALTVVQSAVVVRDGYSYVFSVSPEGRVSQVKVSAGRRMEGRIEILEGIKADAKVVSSGAGFLSDGDLVRVSSGRDMPVKKANSSKTKSGQN
jgi:HlyD family secretion protein